MRVFVSSQAVDHDPASALIRGLRMAGVHVEHSPRNPIDGDDPRWENWYGTGLSAAIRGCDVFVIVVDRAWDSSTWMGSEASAAVAASRDESGRRVVFWNPAAIAVVAAGMTPYLKEELPRDLGAAIRCISEPTG